MEKGSVLVLVLLWARDVGPALYEVQKGFINNPCCGVVFVADGLKLPFFYEPINVAT